MEFFNTYPFANFSSTLQRYETSPSISYKCTVRDARKTFCMNMTNLFYTIHYQRPYLARDKSGSEVYFKVTYRQEKL